VPLSAFSAAQIVKAYAQRAGLLGAAEGVVQISAFLGDTGRAKAVGLRRPDAGFRLAGLPSSEAGWAARC
jgi:hypothetical protein